MSKIKCSQIENYKGLGKALKLSSPKLEIVVTLDIGPRIMHFSKPGQENILEDEAVLSEKLPDGKTWSIYGGHRVWHSPEAYPRSYMPDSSPLAGYEILDDGIIMHQKQEEWTQITKSMEVRFLEESIKIFNRIKNNGAWPVEAAVWSLTVGSRGGREVCPVVQRNTGLLPNTHYVSWPYSKLNDRRVYWGQKYIVVENDPDDKTAFKFGYPNEYGWIAYFNKGMCFIKKFTHQKGANYPDSGCSWETYTSYWGIELESLSPLSILKPGMIAEHVDEWYLYDCPVRPQIDEEQIDAVLSTIAEASGIELPIINESGWDPTYEG